MECKDACHAWEEHDVVRDYNGACFTHATARTSRLDTLRELGDEPCGKPVQQQDGTTPAEIVEQIITNGWLDLVIRCTNRHARHVRDDTWEDIPTNDFGRAKMSTLR